MERSRSRAEKQQNTLLQVDGEAVEAAEVKDTVEVKLMIL